MLPTFIVIGAMKCATTSLHFYLDLHPQIFMSRRQELDFFIAERHWNKGLQWYESQFSDDFGINGESSSSYTKYPLVCDVPERIHSVLPLAKLIYVVRDPVDRIISHYIHEYAQGRENRPIDDALNLLENNHYLDVSKYYLQLRQYLEFYTPDQILVVMTEDLRDQRVSTLQRIFRFLSVDDNFRSDDFFRVLNQSSEKRRKNWLGHLVSTISVKHYKLHASPETSRKLVRKICGYKFDRPVVHARLRHKLVEALRSDVTSLRNLTGLGFEPWSL
jgi:hypothetical protein